MDGLLRGKTAVVTGSTSGIGLGIARALAQAGAAIVLNGFGEPAHIESLRVQLADEHRVTVAYDAADLSRPEEAVRLVETAVASCGSVDVLVNNAGIQRVAPIEAFDPGDWDAIIALNLSSSFHTMRAAFPHMRRRGWGRVINVASAHGLVASAHKSAYVAAKHGLIGLTKVAALETASSGITVNAICPGFVLTPLVQKQIDDLAAREQMSPDDARRRLLIEKQPSGEFVTPEQIAALAVFLCGDAAAQIRGAALSIDGGWTAQ